MFGYHLLGFGAYTVAVVVASADRIVWFRGGAVHYSEDNNIVWTDMGAFYQG